jgi:hypothetical protein
MPPSGMFGNPETIHLVESPAHVLAGDYATRENKSRITWCAIKSCQNGFANHFSSLLLLISFTSLSGVSVYSASGVHRTLRV